jgi:hypothetical protein
MLASAAMAVQLSGLSGHWTFTMNPDFRGNPAVVDCTLKQDGNKLVVQCGTGKPMNGEVKGQKVTFRSPFTSGGTFVTHNADVDAAGANMTGEWHLMFSDGERKDGKFTARKR